MNEHERNFYDVAEFCRMMDGLISRPFAYKLMAAGEIPTIKMGRRLLIPAWYVSQLIAQPSLETKKG